MYVCWKLGVVIVDEKEKGRKSTANVVLAIFLLHFQHSLFCGDLVNAIGCYLVA